MIDKKITFKPPWSDALTVQADILFKSITDEAVRIKVGSYIGDLRDDRAVDMGIHPVFVYIQKKLTGSGNAVFALRNAGGTSFVSGGGFVTNAVKTFEKNGITVGTNVDVNSIGVEYVFMAVG